ncbi:BZ3500_MvSof-1268-A1-R1_Chr2-1g04387 [Microbotryum saponariae]|uniref:BZ3500_MvSof-1268-A1-R1_Chr2-1g04387 protein n=1 Tax=Microbotryum saponariae TaxID=289078 RepID=A0A2X0KYY2_9BASI|nr:BZ3500_MvSof-1268-A1-R1_Chr2-1g04387 [Microbotryum saponariae]SCZ91601.1 BZ3501_MvSof-1269-A2-R1_Chr2-1g04043 [Microbotryum saponariae]
MSSSTTKPKPKPRSSVAGSASSSVPDAVDPKLMELARQIGINRFNALVQSRARSTSTSTPTAPPLNPAPVPSATSLATPESSRSKAAKVPAERKPTSKRKSVNSMALPVVETPPSKKGKSTSNHGKHQNDEDVNGNANDAPTNDDEEERKARKKQRKLDKKEAKRKAALEAEADMEVDELASPVKDSKKKKRKKEQERTDKEVKKRSKKSKKLDKGKGKEIVQDNLNESFSSAANHHPSPPPKPIAEAKSKSKSSSKRPRPSELDSKVAVSPVKTPRKKRKLANGSSAAVPSTQANTAVSAPARPAVNGLPSTSTDSRDLEQLLVQTVNVLRASPSYAHESGVFGEGIVQLFQALVAKVASADMRPEAPPASNHDDDDSTTPEEDEQHRRLSQNSGRAPLNGTEAPVASSSTSSSTRPALTSTFAARPTAAPTATPTAEAPETEAEAAIKARAAKAAKKLLKKERREKKQQKEIGAEAPSSPPEEQEVVSPAPDEEDGPATPLSSPDKSERMNKERPIRKRLGKLEKGALRSMSQSAGSSRQSSLAPTLTLPPAREEIVIKVSDSQAEEAERAAIRAAEATIESSASSPDEEGPLNHSTDPTIRFRGEDDEASENEIDQLASTPVLARPSHPLRQAPRSTISAFSSEDDPEEIELSLRTHASPRKDRPLSLDPEVESGDESEPRTEDDDVEENHKEEDGHARENINDGLKEQHENRGEGDDEPPTRPKIEHDGDAAMADAQAQDESHVEEDAVRRASPITNGVVPSPGQRQPVDPVNVPLPPSPSPPPPIRTIGHDDSDASSSSDDDDSDSSSSSTASNRAYRKPSRPSIGAVATSAFGSAASMRRNRAKRQSSPLKTSSLARTLSSTGPEVDKDAEMEEDVDELLSQPVPKSAVQKLLQNAEEEEQRLEDPRGRSTSVSSSEADTNTAGAVAEPSKEGAVEEQRNGGGEADAGSTQSLKEVNNSLEATTAEPMEAVNLSDIAAQASSAPGTPLMMDTEASQLVRLDHHGVDSDESQYVPLIKSQPFFLEATQQTQRLPGFVDHEGEESQTSSQTILNGSSQVKKAVDAATLDVPSQATPNGRLTRAASLRARTASPGPSATAPSASAPSFKNSDSARPPSASQPLPTTSFRGHGRASSMRALSQLDEATPRRSMRHAGPSTSQGSTFSARGAAVPALSWIRKDDDGENESEDDSSEDEDRKANGTSTRPRKSKVLWN